MIMRILDDIAKRMNADKSSLYHNYMDEYQRHLEKWWHAPIKLLEIGIDKGNSLRVWRDYFSQAEITGIDINPPLNIEGVTCLQGSQADPDFLHKVHREYGPFNVVIDDGSHFNQHQMISFDTLFPLLVPRGTYVIEDLNCCFWSHTGRPVFDFAWLIRSLCRTEGPEKRFDTPCLNLVDGIESLEFYKNILFVRKK
jgi:hypothetical protein